ncbi:PASTA domain-containing protein [Amycolatopsis sp. GM8]|uniref:PASTA domain-containing protein n=1 Tax=Amycolatopsis sp. GM8 TaxID=2896530 RepID=UPI001F1818F3|nr:PASTA domain-containing protein [Amycolatopsis sp. GM8]
MSEDPWSAAQPAWRRLEGLREGATDGDGALSALSDLGLVRRLLDRTEFEAVRIARGDGKSWSEIAVRLGVTRQSAWERWRDIDEPQQSVVAEVAAEVTATARQRRRRGTVLVPELTGLTLENARLLLSQNDLVLVESDATASRVSDWPDGVVLDQSPEPGAKVPPGSPVTVWLSGGGGGGSGVREPRRPKPDPKTGRKMRDEMTDETVN